MKSKNDPRHQKRIKLVQALFAWNTNQASVPEEISSIVSQISEIDQLIAEAAPKWPLSQISQVDLATLRYSVWELKNNQEVPQKVIIDEAIEIGKEFGNESSASFINAVLGHILKIQNDTQF